MLLFCFSHQLYPLSLPVLQADPEACCFLQEGTNSWLRKDGRAEDDDESQRDSEDVATTDSDDESLPVSEGGSSVAPADKVCVKL